MSFFDSDIVRAAMVEIQELQEQNLFFNDAF